MARSSVVLLSLILSVSWLHPERRPERVDFDSEPDLIRGGTITDMREFPFGAELIFPDRDETGDGRTEECSASLIAPNWILTAAHCLPGEEARYKSPNFLQDLILKHEFKISFHGASVPQGGAYSIGWTEIEQVIPHPDPTIDAALIEFNPKANPVLNAPVRIAPPSEEQTVFGGTRNQIRATVVGRGRSVHEVDDGGTWRFAEINVIRSGASSTWDGMCAGRTGPIWICGGNIGRGILRGDSGGPLLVRDDSDWVQIGVTKGFQHLHPGRSFFVRTAHIYDWIAEHVPMSAAPSQEPDDLGVLSYDLHFPVFVVGEGITSDIVLFTNPDNTQPSSGRIRFRDGEGRDIPALSSGQDRFSLTPGEIATISPRGRGQTIVASVLVESNGEVGGVIRCRIPGLGMADMGPPTPSHIAKIPMTGSGFRTGFAFVVTELSPLSAAQVSFTFISSDTKKRWRFIRQGHGLGKGRATFIDDFYALRESFHSRFRAQMGVDIQDFVGWLQIEATDKSLLSVVGYEVGTKEGEFSSLPVVTR